MPRTIWCRTLIVAVVGCVSGADAAVPAIAGRWHYIETMSDDPAHIICSDTGVYDFAQAGMTFKGTLDQVGTCTTPNGTADNHGRDSVVEGKIDGLSFRFRVRSCCEYEGLADDLSPTQLDGRGFWTLDIGGATHTFSGTWEARR